MAVLSQANREAAWKDFMEQASADRETIGVDKNAVFSVVGDLDDFLDSASLARDGLSAGQRDKILSLVAVRRARV